MSDELSAMIRATARDEAAAADREFPYSSATLDRFVGDVRRRRVVGGAMLAVAGVAVVGLGILGLGRPWDDAPPVLVPGPSPTPSVSSSPAPSPSWSPTPEPAPSPSATPSETVPAPDRTSTPSVTTSGVVPGQVTVIDAGPGGGSGEEYLRWSEVADATGYRVYRSRSADGPFVKTAAIDLTTGATEVGAHVLELAHRDEAYKEQFGYLWDVDYSEEEVYAGESDLYYAPTYFRVTAFSAAGEGLPSVVVCAYPAPGAADPCVVGAPDVVPGQVVSVQAGAGGGSGEVVARWVPIANATGYRVYRSDSPDGPFTASASIDIATGETTIESGAPNEYVHIDDYRDAATAWDFEYLEVTTSAATYFRVVAFTAAGEGPPSPVVCASPVGEPEC
ncbi:hypothetical protein [Cellulomonas sp. KRMCY2]|uniref:hypothetical protein n=1 Tax=Cellulomonas sp. KRMCY2 TaxID=1304865 RepID=UPI00045E59B2|nr:hypothetical protein [Cellulomonas sp. KRMCY2]